MRNFFVTIKLTNTEIEFLKLNKNKNKICCFMYDDDKNHYNIALKLQKRGFGILTFDMSVGYYKLELSQIAKNFIKGHL